MNPSRIVTVENDLVCPPLRQVEAYYSDPDGVVDERRRCVRVSYADPVVVRACTAEGELGPSVLAEGKDLSMWGICVVAPERFEPGSDLIVTFHAAPERSTRIVRVPSEVRHVRPEEDGQWLFGCAFHEDLGSILGEAFDSAEFEVFVQPQ